MLHSPWSAHVAAGYPSISEPPKSGSAAPVPKRPTPVDERAVGADPEVVIELSGAPELTLATGT